MMARAGENIELDGVTMRFGAFTAVRDVNLTIEAGEFFSFLGPSGCGKTTLLRLISGFMEPTEGAVRIGGQDMRGVGPNKRPTVLIFQNLALFPLMSVADNIAFGLEVRGVDKPTRRAKAEELLRLVDLPDAGDKKIAQLSGGQKQRVAIARALAPGPKVLLMDEPFAALDAMTRGHLQDELIRIHELERCTTLFVTHNIDEAIRLADRVLIMSPNPGRVVADVAVSMPKPRARTSPEFAELYDLFERQIA
jgi:spermidine/putrescine transport system ATP-binding protein